MKVALLLSFVLLISSVSAVPTSSSEDQVARANVQFAKELYKYLSTEKDKNVVFSPLSAHMCLSMLYQGAGGSTKEVCARGLRIADPIVAAEGYKSLIDTFSEKMVTSDEEGRNVTIAIANKAYIATGGQIKDTFKTAVQDKFGSEVESVDFSNGESAAQVINNWVKEKTKEKIPELLDKKQVQDAYLVLVNAVYFKATWLNQFEVENTKAKPFYLNNEKTVDVPMMYIEEKFSYKDDSTLNAKIVMLSYRNYKYNMVIILPNDKDGIQELEEKLVGYDFNEFQGSYRKVKLSLPKFRIESTMSLADPLKQMGMEEIFSEKADLSGIEEGTSSRVSDVIQKVFVQVEEYGSEATAATALVMVGDMLNPPPPVEFIADHPFVFMLTHKSPSLSVLFYGRVSEPTF